VGGSQGIEQNAVDVITVPELELGPARIEELEPGRLVNGCTQADHRLDRYGHVRETRYLRHERSPIEILGRREFAEPSEARKDARAFRKVDRPALPDIVDILETRAFDPMIFACPLSMWTSSTALKS
jgi:hypothetical protein